MVVKRAARCYDSNEPSLAISSQNNSGFERVYRKTSGYNLMSESTKLGLMCFCTVSGKPVGNCTFRSETR